MYLSGSQPENKTHPVVLRKGPAAVLEVSDHCFLSSAVPVLQLIKAEGERNKSSQYMPLWNVDYFELKTIGIQQT